MRFLVFASLVASISIEVAAQESLYEVGLENLSEEELAEVRRALIIQDESVYYLADVFGEGPAPTSVDVLANVDSNGDIDTLQPTPALDMTPIATPDSATLRDLQLTMTEERLKMLASTGAISPNTASKMQVFEKSSMFAGKKELQRHADPAEGSAELENLLSDSDRLNLLVRPLSPAQLLCSRATEALSNAKSNCGQKCYPEKFFDANSPVTEKVRIFQNAVKEYDRVCLSSLTPYYKAQLARLPAGQNTTVAADELPASIVSSDITNRIGVLVDEQNNDVAFCGAYLWGSDTIVTAKHCFYETSKGNRNVHGDSLIRGGIRLRLIGNKSLSSKLHWPTMPLRYRTFKGTLIDDLLFVNINKEVDDLPSVPNDIANTGDDLFLIGYYVYHDRSRSIERLAANHTEDYDDWFAGIRWSKASVCQALQSTNQCFNHACQSERGFSGAPIFKIDSQTNVVSFVGMQKAMITRSPPRYCEAYPRSGDFNVAISSGHLANSEN